MVITILNGGEIVEGIVGAFILCFLEYKFRKGRKKWSDIRMAALIWCCCFYGRKFAAHIYNSMGNGWNLKT